MPKGPIITDKVDVLIAEVYHELERQWNKIPQAIDVMQEVDIQLEGKGPGLSAIQKRLTKIRTKDKQDKAAKKEIDAAWCLGSLIKYPIVPDALPSVLSVWKQRQAEEWPFTVREALWVARLHSLFTNPKDNWGFAVWYAARERAYEVLGKVPDTSDLDAQLVRFMKGGKRNERSHKKTIQE